MQQDRRSDWHELVDAYRAGKEHKSTFCKRHGLKISTLDYWLYEKGKSSTKEAQFLPVVESTKQESETALELITRSGARLKFISMPPVSYLVQLLTAVS
jgi:hypothetical protein